MMVPVGIFIRLLSSGFLGYRILDRRQPFFQAFFILFLWLELEIQILSPGFLEIGVSSGPSTVFLVMVLMGLIEILVGAFCRIEVRIWENSGHDG